MTNVLEKMKSDWADVRSGKVTVDELGRDVHFKRMSMKEAAEFMRQYDENKSLAIATLVQMRALDEKGSCIFDGKLETTTSLMNEVDPAIVFKIASAIRGVVDEKTATKN